MLIYYMYTELSDEWNWGGFLVVICLESLAHDPAVIAFTAPHAYNAAVHINGRLLVTDVIFEFELGEVKDPNVAAGGLQRLKKAVTTLQHNIKLVQTYLCY